MEQEPEENTESSINQHLCLLGAKLGEKKDSEKILIRRDTQLSEDVFIWRVQNTETCIKYKNVVYVFLLLTFLRNKYIQMEQRQAICCKMLINYIY